MNIMDELSAKIKEAMLSRDEFATTTLRGLKSAILYEEVAKNKRDTGLSNEEIEKVIAREVKRRDDAIELYKSAGDITRAEKEMAEREILVAFLPEQLSDDELKNIAKGIIESGDFTIKDMGRVIGEVKKEVGSKGDGAKIAGIVKELLK